MSDKINKTSLMKAKADFEEIKKFAINEATKNLEEDVSKKVIELMNKTLVDANSLKEDVTINADGTIVTIDSSGGVSVSSEESDEMDDTIDMDSEEVIISDEDDEIEIDNSELEEMNLEEMNFEEQEFDAQAAPAPEAAPAPAPEAAPAPAPEAAPAEAPIEEEPAEDVNPLIQPLMDKMDALMSMMGGEADEDGDEIEIIDDTDVAQQGETPAPAPAPQGDEALQEIELDEFESPKPRQLQNPGEGSGKIRRPKGPRPEELGNPVSEEITFEIVDNEMDEFEDDGFGDFSDFEDDEFSGIELEDEDEFDFDDDILEIVGDMDEDEDEDYVDEVKMMGTSHAVQRTAGRSAGPEHAVRNRERMSLDENKNKARYEAKLAELIKENKSLKKEVNENKKELSKFENGFIKLQENFGQMQDYNAKLVMAYKVAMSNGLTTNEKIQISEQFDKCETVKDAEKLYKSIVSEHQIKVNNPERSIKSTSIRTSPAKSVSQPLYESAEVTRWKQLAGIGKKLD